MGMMLKNLVHPYIQSTTILCDSLVHFMLVYLQVGMISFSSHYADYENPCKVLSNTYRYFNAVIPEDALAKENLVHEDLPEVSYCTHTL